MKANVASLVSKNAQPWVWANYYLDHKISIKELEEYCGLNTLIHYGVNYCDLEDIIAQRYGHEIREDDDLVQKIKEDDFNINVSIATETPNSLTVKEPYIYKSVYIDDFNWNYYRYKGVLVKEDGTNLKLILLKTNWQDRNDKVKYLASLGISSMMLYEAPKEDFIKTIATLTWLAF